MNETGTSWVKTVSLTPPSLQDNTADADRLIGALRRALKTGTLELDIDLEMLRQVPRSFRQWGYRIRCTLFKDRRRWFLAGMQAAEDPTPPLGLAVDLGTSRIVLRLLQLETGRVAAETAFDNPQIAVGPDILTRILHAEKPGGRQLLQQQVIDGINDHIDSLCRSAGSRPDALHLLAVAGNTAMTHLFLGLDPGRMIREPYIPVINRPGVLRAADLHLHTAPHARLFVFPNIGSYFGGDLLAGILYSDMHRSENTAILVDVGTNAEVVLGNAHWLIACAGAAGPALEGGVTRMGMMAAPGVIDRVAIDPGSRRFSLHTIENKPPVGICGSGLIDLAAELFRAGMIDIRGRFLPGVCGNRLVDIDGMPHLVVVPGPAGGEDRALTISQADLDSLIRSKAAMYTILETLTATVGVSLTELKTFFVAGTFGAFIQPASAVTIGMIPDLPLETYRTLGNSSLGGAALVLTAGDRLEEIDRIRDRITYLELNVNQDFMNRFSAAKFLPHTDRSRFPSVGTPGAAGG
jgi:uncharacterized 2Fe-2S/4Fe-4S cluster protein (DUF4445 family)